MIGAFDDGCTNISLNKFQSQLINCTPIKSSLATATETFGTWTDYQFSFIAEEVVNGRVSVGKESRLGVVYA